MNFEDRWQALKIFFKTAQKKYEERMKEDKFGGARSDNELYWFAGGEEGTRQILFEVMKKLEEKK